MRIFVILAMLAGLYALGRLIQHKDAAFAAASAQSCDFAFLCYYALATCWCSVSSMFVWWHISALHCMGDGADLSHRQLKAPCP